MQGLPNSETVYTGRLPNVPVYTPSCAPIQSSLSECRGKTNDDIGSTTSESSSTVSFAVRSSFSESSMDESQSARTDPIKRSSWQYDYGMPQVFLPPTVPPLPPTVPHAYQQVAYSPQHCQNFPTSELGNANAGYVSMIPYQLQQAPVTTFQTCPVQVPYYAFPMELQQTLTTSSDFTRVPASTGVVTSVGDPMVYSPAAKSGFQQACQNLLETEVTSPLGSCPSMPGYTNTYRYVNSSVVPSTPCTPMPYLMQSSVVPPMLHLSNNLLSTNIPDQISCNINTTQEASAISNTEMTDMHASDKMELSKPCEREVESLWVGNCSYKECNDNGGSNLFITWNRTESELLAKLQHYKFEVRTASKCSNDGIFNVVFENHVNARKAFLMQSDVRLKMVPPKGSRRNWLRNPSPKHLVKFETRCRLVVKKGKAECHEIVGDLLMSNCQKQKGCIILADQLKGHRIRIVSCEGNFMFPGGRIVQMNGVAVDSDRQNSLGWISYRCKYTRESFVTRRSGISLSDYIYRE